MASRIEGNFAFTGDVSFAGAITLPADASVETSKLQHRNHKCYAQEAATTAADESRVIHTVYGTTGTIKSFKGGCVVANIGDSTVTFDLKKNGTTVLSGVVTLNSTHSAYQVVAGSISSASVAASDVLSVTIDATVGTGTLGKGAFAELVIDELAA